MNPLPKPDFAEDDLDAATAYEIQVLAYCQSLARQCGDLLRSVGRDVDAMKFDALS
jgi:hypothetical protein